MQEVKIFSILIEEDSKFRISNECRTLPAAMEIFPKSKFVSADFNALGARSVLCVGAEDGAGCAIKIKPRATMTIIVMAEIKERCFFINKIENEG